MRIRPFTSLPRSVLMALALFYAFISVGYVVVETYQARVAPGVDPGFSARYLPSTGSVEIAQIRPDGPAERAGLRVGDRVLAIDGQPVAGISFYKATMSGRLNQVLRFTVTRPGIQPGREEQVTLRVTLAPPPAPAFKNVTASQHIVGIIIQNGYFLLLLIVALGVLFLRITDSNAWLLAACFGSFVASGPIFAEAMTGVKPFEGLIQPAFLRAAFVSFETAGWVLGPPLFNYFFAVFPSRSPLDRRLPWLKSTLLASMGAFAAYLWFVTARAGFVPVMAVVSWLGAENHLILLFPLFALGSLLCGLVSLVLNNLFPVSSEARRKTQVMVWGTVAAILPVVLISIPTITSGNPPKLPLSVFLVIGLLACLMPLSFAYAVVKHRVLEIPVLLKISARYLLVRRGFAVFLISLFSLANALFTLSYLHFFPSGDVGFAIAMGVSFGALLLWLSAPVVRQATKRIDRAFFRSDYDARQVLENLARNIRKVTRREQLATLLERELNQALHVRSMAIYLEGSDSRLILQNEVQPGMKSVLSSDIPVLQELTRRAEPFEIVPAQQGDRHPPPLISPFIFGSIRPECLVPMMGNDGHLAGLVALGARLSEQPYSGEDKRLLASVASQAELALESIQRGEEIAERIEADRRLVQEMEFARQVQARLFPQHLPALQTLEYAGACSQARQVGGDYYDFLESHSGRLALVLADVAGKGVSGALIMANLQANLRSQYATALEDPQRLLSSVNRLFFENTSENSYATLFFADYEDSNRKLRFVNCGHLPALVLRTGHASDDQSRSPCAVERLEPTSTVLGLFEQWECSVGEVRLFPGDLLVLYTDGVTEATNPDGQEFGESRLIDALRAHVHDAPASLVDVIVRAVQQFGDGEQADDITLVVARCTA